MLVFETSISAEIKTFVSKHPEINEYVIGTNRYEVGVNLAKYYNVTPSSNVFTRGDIFADALSGGPLVAYTSSPILLTPSTKPATEVESYLQDRLVLLSQDVADKIFSYIQ